jgi:hypothetical protein
MPSPLESLLIPSSRVFVDTRVRCFIQQCLAYCSHPHHALCSLISLFAQQLAVDYCDFFLRREISLVAVDKCQVTSNFIVSSMGGTNAAASLFGN